MKAQRGYPGTYYICRSRSHESKVAELGASSCLAESDSVFLVTKLYLPLSFLTVVWVFLRPFLFATQKSKSLMARSSAFYGI